MSNINLYENKNQQIRSTSDLLGYIQEFVLPAIVASSPSGGITLAQMTALMESLLISPTNSSTVGFNSKVAIDLLLDIMKELSLVDGTQSVFYDPNTNDNNVLASLRNLLYSIDDKGTNSNTMLQLIQSYMNSGSGSVFKNESGQKLLDLMLSHLSDISQNSETIETYIGLIKDFQSTSLGDSVFKNSGGQKLLQLILDAQNSVISINNLLAKDVNFKNGVNSVFFNTNTGQNDILSSVYDLLILINSYLLQIKDTNVFINNNTAKSSIVSTIIVPANASIGAVSSAITINDKTSKIVIVISSNLLGNLTLRSDNDVLPSKIMSVVNMANNTNGSNMVASASFQANMFNKKILFSQSMSNLSSYTIEYTQFLT